MKELPFDQKTAAFLNGAMERGTLASLAAEYRLTPEHFLISRVDVFTPLHYALFAGYWSQIVEASKSLETPLAFAHFLAEDSNGWTGLQWAAAKGFLTRVQLVARPQEGEWTAENFLRRNKFSDNALQMAANAEHLDQIFIPSLWVGRVGEMNRLWRHVPEPLRQWVDYDAVVKETISLSIERVPRLDFEKARRAVAVETGLSPQTKERA